MIQAALQWAANIDPVALELGAIQVHWYGLMYVFGFGAGWFLAQRQVSRSGSTWTSALVDDLVVWAMIGVVVGGRAGYLLVYDWPAFAANPLVFFQIWNGGMSFHGGLLGVLVALWLWGKRQARPFLAVVDFVAPCVAPGLFFGRIGNFINGELWGAVTDGPFGVVFASGGPLPRHPSQLYEAGLEGLLLFIVVWKYAATPRPLGRVSGVFAVAYALFRSLVEFVRQPDPQLGYLAFGWLTMGQLLSLPLLLVGLWFLLRPARIWIPSHQARKARGKGGQGR